jgi:hypothetical protein
MTAAELTTVETSADAIERLQRAGMPLSAVRVGPGLDGAGRRRVRFPDGGELEIRPGAMTEWLVPGSALVVRSGGGLLLLWVGADVEARRAVTARLAQEIGARRLGRLLKRMEGNDGR